MSLKITVVDEQTGDVGEARIPEGEYMLIVHEPCYLSNSQRHANGTVQLTIKDHSPKVLAP